MHLPTLSWPKAIPILLFLSSHLAAGAIIDDSQWNTPALQLSDGWNMLRPSQTEAIDQFEVTLMRPLLPLFFNQSISWTQRKGANYTLRFTGTGITIVGAKGPSASLYNITLDGKPITPSQPFDAAAQVFSPNETLWSGQGLGKGEHVVVVGNSGDGFLYFDYANVTTTPAPVPSSSAVPMTSTTPAPATAAPFVLPYDPAALRRLTEVYEFKMNSRVYFVIILTASMLLLAIILIIHHHHRNRTTRTPTKPERASKSFIGGAPPDLHTQGPFFPGGTKDGPMTALKKTLRKSKISQPIPSATGYRPFSEEDDDLVLAPQARKLRPRDIEDPASGGEERRGVTLADALREDEEAYRAREGGKGKRVTRDMF